MNRADRVRLRNEGHTTDEIDRMESNEEIDKLRAENAELREKLRIKSEAYSAGRNELTMCMERLAEARNTRKELCGIVGGLQDEKAGLQERLAEAESERARFTKLHEQRCEELRGSWNAITAANKRNDTLSDKLAATEALLAEWVAWGRNAYVQFKITDKLLGEIVLPPMPKERVE